MIGNSWKDDPVRAWQFRLSHLLIRDWCDAGGVQVQRIATNAFRIWREGVWTVIGGALMSLPTAIRLAAYFICTGDAVPRDANGNRLCLECWAAKRTVGCYCRECNRNRKNESQRRHKRSIS